MASALGRVCNYRRLMSNIYGQARLISTSKNNRETATVSEPLEQLHPKREEKNWISYGFDMKDKEEDRNAMNSTMFFSVTLCLVVGSFIWAYSPDYQNRDWAQREAFLEIRRREALGLPHIDPNLIDPDKVVLPTDEELGDTEIII
ncbi:NADH dehydrogenase [ubiquinone] 1 beta subcomplex subunit 11, mitochondrial [Schistocerca gregaria]|uniref:NADH dehydrogenase [ubiquinone] 1 beta subcomplex subunit 11, mitochondrial n=1 Tax=Schistocerca gregaria TaxID=7010 RepID=UPI00211ED92A|nr:NADH dehydrogenase [ubiquinone] 1 beta subcomplex subunit 11, mitochondrial [Schistocerca gregaria]